MNPKLISFNLADISSTYLASNRSPSTPELSLSLPIEAIDRRAAGIDDLLVHAYRLRAQEHERWKNLSLSIFSFPFVRCQSFGQPVFITV